MVLRLDAVFPLLLLSCFVDTIAEAAPCVDNLKQISDAEEKISDLTLLRTYELCSDTAFNVGSYQDIYNHAFSGNKITLRPNLHIQCGSNGRRANNCVVKGGDMQLDGSLRTLANANLNNIVFTGITFQDSKQHVGFFQKPGDVLFRDCEFRGHTQATKVPIHLDYFDDSSNQDLTVRFRKCDFLFNTFAGSPAQPSLIVASSSQNKLEITDCKFENNDMKTNNSIASRNSFLVESSGDVELTRNCFRNNRAKVALVAVYGKSLVTSNNYHGNLPGEHCQFAAWFKTASSFQSFSPICVDFDATTCNIGAPPLPTPSPTQSPTTPPTNAPSVSPTPAPTNDPTASPSKQPSVSPSVTPSAVPTESTQPSDSPSTPPTRSPTSPLQSPGSSISLILSLVILVAPMVL